MRKRRPGGYRFCENARQRFRAICSAVAWICRLWSRADILLGRSTAPCTAAAGVWFASRAPDVATGRLAAAGGKHQAGGIAERGFSDG